jgi:tRNA threonylcarbamoyladenosine modification (KEOPS) complex  Pcc1 subunit
LEANPTRAKATVRIKLPSRKHLETILNSLRPESKSPTTSRSSTTLKKEGLFLVLKLDANDTVALRAAMNAYLRWINSALNVLEVLKTQ